MQTWPTLAGSDPADIGDIKDALDTLRSNWSGTARPSSPVAGQLFYDTDSGPILEICTNATGPAWAGLATVLSASELLTKLLTVDGSGSGLDADLLDGQNGAYYLAASSYTAADVLSKLLTVDGSGSGLDADLLDGQSGADYLDLGNATGNLSNSRVPDNTLSIAKIAAAATARLFGRKTASAGAGEELTTSEALKFISSTQGDILYYNGTDWVALGAGTSGHFLKTNGAGANPAWAAASGGVSDGDKGDITVSGSGATFTIDNDVVTYAKMQNVSATSRLLGRKTAGAGDVEELTLSEVLDFIGSAAQGDLLFRGASSWSRLAAGTSGYVLSTNGAGADPSWGTVGNSGFANSSIIAARMRITGPCLVGRTTASLGSGVEVTLGSGLGLASDVLSLNITGLTADTSPDHSADYVPTYDNSATTNKKVLMSLIGAGKQAFYIPASAMAPRVSNGCAALATVETTTNKQNFDHLAFDPTTQEFAVFTWRAPKAIGTSTLTAIFDWSHPSTTTNFGVVWGLSAAGRGDGDALEIAMGTAVTATDTGGTTDTLYVSPVTGAMTVGGSFAAEDILKFQVSRNPSDGSDTMAVDARLHGVWLIFTTTQNTEQ